MKSSTKSAAKIYMDYQKTISQVEALENIALKLRNLANSEFANTISHINLNWKGEAASEYITKANRVKFSISTQAKQVSNAATALRNIAERTYKAEMANLALLED